jgi:urea carboxylase
MFDKVLVANRGEIACRIFRTLKRLGTETVAVYSEADSQSLHVALADEAVCVGPAQALKSYLDVGAILEAARATGAQAIHPGYGFLSENAKFAEACRERGVAFIGPQPDQIRAFGLKHRARELAQQAKVPLLPGTPLLDSLEQARSEAKNIGYPIMLKSSAGGGGIGLQLCRDESRLSEQYESVVRLSTNNFDHGGVYLEKFVERARHLEVQIFGDGKGNVIALGVRDCSLQRRNQKVVEETPAPGLDPELMRELSESAVSLGSAVQYESAGTVEFVFDADARRPYFLEVNTRLQVEHGITELVFGIDLVEWMLRQAAGELGPLSELPQRSRGHAIEVRLYAEDPHNNFLPSSGTLTEVVFPDHTRVDGWVERGTEITPYYDPLIAKLVVRADSRAAAIDELARALAATRLSGIETNLEYLREVCELPDFRRGDVTTGHLGRLVHHSSTIDVLAPGIESTLQDYPGRLGYWAIGVPPSGPMDHLALRLGNRIVGNPEGATALEITMSGPTLRFNTDAVIALAGADMQAELDGERVPPWRAISIKAGQKLELRDVLGHGCRAYLCVQNGFDVPEYLGSTATFTLGGFGGHAGRALRTGDVLHIVRGPARETAVLSPEHVPSYTSDWQLGVLYGPHGAPDFFTEGDIETFFASEWKVHYNSARTGVRLIGPKPEWARPDGGEAGLHPSNIHDTAYAVGTVDFTGDMPIILGPDGPSLGGFVCPATLVKSELWKIGQLRPGDRVRFVPMTASSAREAEAEQERAVANLDRPAATAAPRRERIESAILRHSPAEAARVEVNYRRAGDRYLLVEYGPMVLDLDLRFRVHALMTRLRAEPLPGVIDLTPGIRSLQVHYDPRTLPTEELIDDLAKLEDELEPVDRMEVPTRIVHLPLSWNDEAAQLAVLKYTQLVRKDAPWAPSNIEFIRRINGLSSIEEVKEIVFGASYLVLGLGDVYLGAPVATPLDPRHRLVTTKYNPARTWTPENAVGIGGAYLCIYGMEGPGGYQLVGRTVQVYNRFRQTADFKEGKPWLLRFFDQIRFYPVSGPELLRFREDFMLGRVKLSIEDATFQLADYKRFLNENRQSISAFKTRQQSSFNAERQRWIDNGQLNFSSEEENQVHEVQESKLPPGGRAVASPVPGSVWKIAVAPGHRVSAGDTLVVVESMKMEIAVLAPCAGEVAGVLCAEGRAVAAGQTLLVVRATA